MSIERILCKVKIFQLQSLLDVIRCIDQRFAFKNSVNSCLALIFNKKNQSTTVLNAKISVAGGEIRRLMYQFFLAIDTNQCWSNGLVVKAGSRESGDLGSIPDEC